MWNTNDQKQLERRVKTRDFAESLALANSIGALAERANHHPDLVVRWGELVVTLFTHSASKVTDKDHALAGEIDRLLDARKPAAPR